MAQPMDPRAPYTKSQDPHTLPTGSYTPISHVLAPPTHGVLDLYDLTMGCPTTQLMDPDNPITGAHITIPKHPDPSSLRPQIQHWVLDPQNHWRIPDPHASSPGSPSSTTGFWISRSLSHRIPTMQCLDPGAPSHWIPDPLTPTTGFLNSFTLTLSPGSLCFDYWIPYISTTTPSTPNHRISDSQALTGWILAPKSTM